MTKSEAIKIMGCLLRAQKALDDAAEIVEQLKNPEELLEFRKALAASISINYVDIMAPIIQQYPELNPYPKKKDR